MQILFTEIHVCARAQTHTKPLPPPSSTPLQHTQSPQNKISRFHPSDKMWLYFYLAFGLFGFNFNCNIYVNRAYWPVKDRHGPAVLLLLVLGL